MFRRSTRLDKEINELVERSARLVYDVNLVGSGGQLGWFRGSTWLVYDVNLVGSGGQLGWFRRSTWLVQGVN